MKRTLIVSILFVVIMLMFTSCDIVQELQSLIYGTSLAPHTHSFGAVIIIEPTCTTRGEKYRTCECGLKESLPLPAIGHNWKNATCTEAKECLNCHATQGNALGHTTDNGVCDRCGAEEYPSYELALKALDKQYAEWKSNVQSLRTQYEVKRSILNGTMRQLGISYLSSSSYYNQKIQTTEYKLNNKYSERSYAQMAGNYSKVAQLNREIADLEADYKEYLTCYDLAQEQELIDLVLRECDKADVEADRMYQEKLREIQQKYQ